MPDIRTVLTTMSPLFSDILVQQIGGHVDLDIVAKIDTRDRLEERLRAIGPDLVLIGLYHGEADEIAHSLLAAAPVAKVIAFSTDGRHAYVHERGGHCTALIAQSALLGFAPHAWRVNPDGYPGDDRLHLCQRVDPNGPPSSGIHLGAEASAGQGV